MRKTVRIYGRELESWWSEDDKGRRILRQIELEYTEYDIETCEIVATGSEDFSKQRYKDTLLHKMVWTWDGQKRNRGGHRWFEYSRDVKYIKGKGKEVKTYLKNMYKMAVGIEDVDVR